MRRGVNISSREQNCQVPDFTLEFTLEPLKRIAPDVRRMLEKKQSRAGTINSGNAAMLDARAFLRIGVSRRYATRAVRGSS